MICITGDTHADMTRFKDKKIKSLKTGDILIICGDFGFIWDDSPKERAAREKIGSMKFTTLFVDGCHENFDLLNKFPEEELFGGKVRRICGNLLALERGYIYELDGYSFFAFGGGQSANAEERIDAHSYWEEEMPSAEELDRGLENLKKHDNAVDYIITHEPPASIKDFLGFETQQTSELSAFLENVRSSAKFTMWYFGKTHRNKIIPPRFTSIFDDVVSISPKYLK